MLLKVGCEFDHIPVGDYNNLLVALPAAKLVDIAEASMYLRMIKSPEEIVLTKECARMADLGGAAARAAMAEGVPEHEVSLAATRTMVREIAKTFPHHEVRDGKLTGTAQVEFWYISRHPTPPSF